MINEKKVYLLLTATAVLWGGNSVAGKFTVNEISPTVTAFVRFTWVTLIYIGITLYTQGRGGLPRREQLPGIVILGFAGIFCQNYFFYNGVKLSTAANASLLAAANPAVTALLSAVFYHERLLPQQILGIIVSFLGAALVITKGSWQVITGLAFNRGDILLAIAPITWAAYSLVGRKVMRGMTALAATTWSSVAGTVMLGVVAFTEGYRGPIELSFFGWLNMLYMILGSGVLAFYWWNRGVAVVGPNRAAIFINMMPVSGMIFAALFLRETISIIQIAGALLIIAGVWLTTQVKITESVSG